ncbi:zinc-dependent alcohol dehydrogenase family protein [Streptomyces sp. NPDC101225]|uniref:zinc-dependent alcohol dehydrogenase family protein n=1 Tax=Streptomyces sp. NPDC101225 TaxID=3366135 RepID=UPI003801160E
MRQVVRAVILDGVDGPLEVGELENPVAGPGRVLIRIAASGVNPLDTKIRRGQAPHAQRKFPAVPGLDMAGTVVRVGPGVTGFQPGDEVYGMTGGAGDLQGSLAQYAAVDARFLAHKPTSLSMRETAALPLVVITAWEALIYRAQVRGGQKVLVHGGAGGIGHVAVQIARSRGAEVFATTTSRDFPVVEGFGAVPIDYTSTAVEDYVARYTEGEGFDVVFDTVGGAVLDASFDAVHPYTGHVVSAQWGSHSISPLSFRSATYSGVFALAPMLSGHGRQYQGEIMREAAALVDAGTLKPLLFPDRFALSDADDAYDAVESRTRPGKVVVDVEH